MKMFPGSQVHQTQNKVCLIGMPFLVSCSAIFTSAVFYLWLFSFFFNHATFIYAIFTKHSSLLRSGLYAFNSMMHGTLSCIMYITSGNSEDKYRWNQAFAHTCISSEGQKGLSHTTAYQYFLVLLSVWCLRPPPHPPILNLLSQTTVPSSQYQSYSLRTSPCKIFNSEEYRSPRQGR